MMSQGGGGVLSSVTTNLQCDKRKGGVMAKILGFVHKLRKALERFFTIQGFPK